MICFFTEGNVGLKVQQMNSMSVIPQPQEIAFQWKSGDLSSRTSSSLSSPGDDDDVTKQSSDVIDTPTSVHSTPVCVDLLDCKVEEDDVLSRVRSAPARAVNRNNGWGAALSFDAVATPQRKAIGARWQIAVSYTCILLYSCIS